MGFDNLPTPRRGATQDPFADLPHFDGGNTIKPKVTPLDAHGEDAPGGTPATGEQLPNQGTATPSRPR